MENVIAHVDDFKGKMAQNIREFAQQGIDSKRWATIILDVPIDLDEEALKLKLPDFDGLKVLFEELEFKLMLKGYLIFMDRQKQQQSLPTISYKKSCLMQLNLKHPSILKLLKTPHIIITSSTLPKRFLH